MPIRSGWCERDRDPSCFFLGCEIPISDDASAPEEPQASRVVVVAAPPSLLTMPASLEVEDPWLAELRSIIDSRDALSFGARCAVRRVVQAIVLEDCSPRESAQAEGLLLLLLLL